MGEISHCDVACIRTFRDAARDTLVLGFVGEQVVAIPTVQLSLHRQGAKETLSAIIIVVSLATNEHV